MDRPVLPRLSAPGAMAAVFLHTACAQAAPAIPTPDGAWDRYGYASSITCGARPVLLTGSHMDLTVRGNCRTVRVAGAHNDIDVELEPGGRIEITGKHNDVTWHLLPGAPVAPVLLDQGTSNTFHAGNQ